MSERDDMERRLYEACLSGSVAELDALIEKDRLILDRVSSFTCFFNDTPLHVAALRGHLDLTKALLTRNPKLASELDSLRCSPLHIASSKGHVEIVRELLRVNTNVCLARDQNGRTPLHLATIKGRVEVIRELLSAKPESIREKLDIGETVLHLCVKYNRVEALKTLVEYQQGNEFLFTSRDDDGNTILHLAASLKQMDTIKYLLGIKNVKEHCTNVKNRSGFTALDIVDHCPNRDLKSMEIREFLLQAGVRRSIYGGLDLNPESSEPPPEDPNRPPPPRHCHCGCKVLKVTGQCISTFWTKYVAIDHLWLQQVRGHLITAATLTATMAYQAILSPPGGFWQEDKDGHIAGRAVVDDKKDNTGNKDIIPTVFLGINSVVLFASLCTIMLAMSGFPHHNKLLLWLLIFAVYITLTCLAISYVLAITLLFPFQMDDSALYRVVGGLLLVWFGVVAFVLVLHACHFFVWLGKKFANLVKICCCRRRRRRSGPNNHIPQNPATTGSCC